jgi:hypothetical protein
MDIGGLMRFSIVSAVVLLFLSGCNSTPHDVSVEISPDKWLSVKQTDRGEHSTRMELTWKNKIIVWDEPDVPVSLREWEGNLYLIGFNREDIHNVAIYYYKLTDTEFVRIKREEFPKRIATQNMWLRADDNSYGNNGKVHNILDITRRLDVEDNAFKWSMTGYIWMHIQTGKLHDEIANPRELCALFKKEFDPIPLKNILPQKPSEPEKTEK